MLQKPHFPIETVFDSLQTQKGLELFFRSQFLDNCLIFFFLFNMVLTGQVLLTNSVYFSRYSVKCIFLCLGIGWRHETWLSKILNFDFLENEKSFWRKIKSISPRYFFRIKKQTSDNVSETTFNPNKAGLFEGSFFWGEGGGKFEPFYPSYFKKNSSSINITLHNY